MLDLDIPAAAGDPAPDPALLRRIGRTDYESTWRAMQAFTDARKAATDDEIWLTEHPPVYTLGLAGRRDHVLRANGIPVIRVDRGGQVTYHGPGQLVAYLLFDLRRARLGVRDMVRRIEAAVIAWLASCGIAAYGKVSAPGIYVDGRKVASIGLRIRRGCSYHGLAFNVAMDLEPFRRINPCGFRGLEVTDLRTLGVSLELRNVAELLAPHLLGSLGMHVDPRWT